MIYVIIFAGAAAIASGASWALQHGKYVVIYLLIPLFAIGVLLCVFDMTLVCHSCPLLF